MKRAIVFYSLVLFLFLASATSYAAEDVVLRHSFAGNLSFELTGNTLRQESNTCRPVSSGRSSGRITLPPGSSIKAAYLYWSGSGSPDNTIRFRNVTSGIATTVNSDVTYLESISNAPFFSAKKDVTSFVSQSTATYEVSNLTFDGSSTYCTNKRAYGGWALAIVYENSNQPLRVINVFDGFKNFWGQSLTLSPNNFVIAQAPASKGGKHAHITWEGDSGNSQSRGGFNESLRFEGINLTDSGNPSSNQFNSFSNVNGDTSGVDIDAYNIGSLLTAGDTSVTTTYSSGQDRVFLTAEIISVPNEPVAELSIQQSGPTKIVRNQLNEFEFTVANNGPNTALNNTQVRVALPSNFTMDSFVGNQWLCTQITGAINCNYTNDIFRSRVSTPLTVRLKPNNSTNNSVNISATVTGTLFDNILSNNTTSKTYNVVSANLSTSKKTVIDINGGNVRAGDVLRYQIDLVESNGASASGITLIDHLPTNISSFEIISLPNGAIDNNQVAPAGDNSSGLLSISNISILANATESIIFDATISSSIPVNTAIKNTATISGSISPEIEIESPTVYVSKPAKPASGNKPLYLRQTSILSRVQPTSSAYNSIADLDEITYVITPAFQKEFLFSETTVNAYLFLQNDFSSRGPWRHDVTVSLLLDNVIIGSVIRTISVPSRGSNGDNVALFDFAIPLPNTLTIQPGNTLALKVQNNSEYSEDSLRIYSIDPNVRSSDSVSPFSLIMLPAATVINIDKISILNSADSQPITEAEPSDSVTITAEVSDPFGSFDISSANISIKNSQGLTLVNQQNMSVLSDSGNAIKTFQFNYAIPANAELGDWNISITALEGIENEINHTSESIFKIRAPLPEINVSKSIEVYSDPIHGTNNANNYAKALPGAILTYTVTAENTGQGTAQNNSIWISDAVPDNTYMIVTDYDDVNGQGPIKDTTAGTSNGLTYEFTALNSTSDDIEFSNSEGANFNYSPVEDSEGLDKNITHFRINPKGIFQAPTAGESPIQFTIKFRVQLQ
jgi:uncharacterized repeat protein (TIGR01451 family)